MTKAFLEKHGIPYINIDVGSDKEAAERMVDISGQYGVPVTTWGDEVIVGFDSEKLHALVGKEVVGGEFDVVIIGAGPAGLTAAMYCSRKSLATALISEDIGGQALWSWSIDNYMGYRMVTGEDLMKKFEEQVKGASHNPASGSRHLNTEGKFDLHPDDRSRETPPGEMPDHRYRKASPHSGFTRRRCLCRARGQRLFDL
jgi:Alkyl hydroperoxide reductase, large subunit